MASFREVLAAPWGRVRFSFDADGELEEITMRASTAVGPHGKRPSAAPSRSQLQAWLDSFVQARPIAFPGPWRVPGASDFRKAVYSALIGVPPGQTVSYGELARLAGSPGASRAVGTAMGENPLPLLIP